MLIPEYAPRPRLAPRTRAAIRTLEASYASAVRDLERPDLRPGGQRARVLLAAEAPGPLLAVRAGAALRPVPRGVACARLGAVAVGRGAGVRGTGLDEVPTLAERVSRAHDTLLAILSVPTRATDTVGLVVADDRGVGVGRAVRKVAAVAPRVLLARRARAPSRPLKAPVADALRLIRGAVGRAGVARALVRDVDPGAPEVAGAERAGPAILPHVARDTLAVSLLVAPGLG
mmetsp:Transcript_4870/g.10778  ORF Transcript_4870/g.10778 Transcript_4870/m.10778 type:complete len:231 (-) Transcript_4870:345-1037(-)